MKLFQRNRRSAQRKVVVVGLDGVPHSLLTDLMDRGRLPNISSLRSKGYFGSMEVSIPEISSVSWSSFMTGTQCGEHGIYGFIDLRPNSYDMFFPNFSHLKGPIIWDELAKREKRSVVINLPSTYPAREINGILISGFVAIDLERAVYPRTLLPVLQEMDYRIDIDTTKAREDHAFLIRDLTETLAARERTLERLWSHEAWDVLMMVVTGTDRLNHYLWEALEDENHIHHRDFLEYYEQVDKLIGRIYERYSDLPEDDSGKNFLMLSDHGFTGIRSEVYLNQWLKQNGYLRFEKNTPESLNDIAKGSTAFALDPSRIYINSKDRYPKGTVDKDDIRKVTEEIVSGLNGLSCDGHSVMEKVYFRDELYKGSFLSSAPDLVGLSRHGFDLKGSIRGDEVFRKGDLSGMHTQDDAFFFSDRGLECRNIFEPRSLIIESVS